MYTIGRVAAKIGLSRTALLYYESIGLLSPAKRADNRYRLYTDSDIERLKIITSLRNTGVSLKEIKKCIDSADTDISSILLKRLNVLNTQLENIKKQQEVIIKLLKQNNLSAKRMDKQVWIKILNDAGINSSTALEWHRNFERQSPEQHNNLLLALGFNQKNIAEFIKIIAPHENTLP